MTKQEIPHNLFGPSAQIGQLFGIFLKKAPITYPLSMYQVKNIYFFKDVCMFSSLIPLYTIFSITYTNHSLSHLPL